MSIPRIGRFLALEPLPEGASDPVIAGWDPELDRAITIELLGTHGSDEARILAGLAHPNVVRVHEVGEHEGQVFLAMERVRGRTLASWYAERGRFRDLLEPAIAAARGLAAVHAVGLCHGELDPSKLWIDREGRLRLVGFALARAGATTFEDDQLALCASLWTIAGAGRRLPRWFAAVLRRGLTDDPRARWPSMDALVVALERGRDRSRRVSRVAALLGLATATALVLSLRPPATDPCRDAPDALASVWTAERRETLLARVGAVGSPSAIASFASVTQRLDHFAMRWQTESFAACEAARNRGELASDPQAALADDPTLGCLDECRTALAVVLEQIGELEQRRLIAATTLTLALPDPTRCRERVAVSHGERARDVALRLARASTLVHLGSLAEADPILADLDAEGWGESASLASRGHLIRASAANHRGDFVRAYEEARLALALAERADDIESEAESWLAISLAELARERADEGAFAVDRTASTAEAVGAPALRWEAMRARAGLALLRGHYDEAVQRFRDAEQIVLRHAVDPQLPLASIYSDMSPAVAYAGRLEEAVAIARRAVELLEEVLGPDSPRTIRAVGTLGISLAHLGEADESIAVLSRAVTALDADPDASPLDRTTARVIRAEQLAFVRRFDESLAELALLQRQPLDDSIRLMVDMTRAMALMESGHAVDAVAAYDGLLAGFPVDGSHFAAFNRAVLHVNLALALSRAGRVSDALALIEPTLAEYRGLDMPATRQSGALVELSEVYRAADRPGDAAAQCERALALLAADDAPPMAFAQARLGLARALLQLGKRAEGREQARLAAAGFRAAHRRVAAEDAEALAR